MYKHIAIAMKLEEKFGFLEERLKSHRKQLPEDKTYVLQELVNTPWKNSDDFIKEMMSCSNGKKTFYCTMKWIFTLFKGVSIILIFMITFVVGYLLGK